MSLLRSGALASCAWRYRVARVRPGRIGTERRRQCGGETERPRPPPRRRRRVRSPSPGGSKTASTEASQKGTFDADAEYDKGAALAAARRFADARQVFEEAARRAPTDGALAAAVAIFADLAAKRISEDVVQRLFQAGQHANARRWAEAYADVDEAIRLAPGYPRAHGLRGTLLLRAGQARGRAQGVRSGRQARSGVRRGLLQSRRDATPRCSSTTRPSRTTRAPSSSSPTSGTHTRIGEWRT